MQLSEKARENMILCQLEPGEVLETELLDCIARTPRELFVPPAFAGSAYIDEDLPIGYGRYLMEPLVFARLLQLADIHAHDRVLIIGGATGYAAAVVAKLTASVTVVESQRELTELARAALQSTGTNVEIFTSALTVGYPSKAPYDLIIIDGGVQTVPTSLIDQLADGGRLVTIENRQQQLGVADGLGKAMLISKRDGEHHTSYFFDASVPVLPGFERKRSFEF